MLRSVPAVPLRFCTGRNRRPILRGGRYILAAKVGRAVDPGGFGNRLVGKVRRRDGRRAEILATVGRHLGSKCRDSRQRKTGGCECDLQPSLHDFSPSPHLHSGDQRERGGSIFRRFAVIAADQRLPVPIWATALISTLSEESANAATCTRVEVGKLPVKNSRRACHTFSRWVMSVTKIVTLTTSAILPPAASTRWRILPKISFAWAYSSPTVPLWLLPRAVMPAT